MHIDFAMWRTAIWQLIKIDKKQEWDALDVVSKWLIATRSAVTLVTVYSCVIAGILAWRDGYFSWIPFLIVTLGLFIAHGTNNLLNDYTDYSRGVDKDNYFRTQYGVHPLVQGFFSKAQQLRWFLVSGVLATLAGIYALIYTNFNLVVIVLFALGALVLLAYTYPFKYWGLGEFAIFLIWGPIMIGGVYLVMALIRGGDISNIWNVVLAGVPYGLGVASINIGKHIDKHGRLQDVPPEYFAKLIYRAVDYAQPFGLPPHRDFRHAQRLLAGIDPSLCPDEFEFGQNGRPHFLGHVVL